MRRFTGGTADDAGLVLGRHVYNQRRGPFSAQQQRRWQPPARGRAQRARRPHAARAGQGARSPRAAQLLVVIPLVIAVLARLPLPGRAVRPRRADPDRRRVRAGRPRLVGRPRRRPRDRADRLRRLDISNAGTLGFLIRLVLLGVDAARRAADRRPRRALARRRRRVHRGDPRPRGAEHARQRAERPAADQRPPVQDRRARPAAGRQPRRPARGHGDRLRPAVRHVRARRGHDPRARTRPC